jgi:hypothetical protein
MEAAIRIPGNRAFPAVDWVPNFGGQLEEPAVLPARLPNLLLNGTTGIAVGMATDVPTGAEIISPRSDLAEFYEKGTGSFKARASWKMEEDSIIVNALPYQVSGSNVLQQIADQFQAKKLPMLDDFRDESDHEHPTRLVIVPKGKKVDVEQLMAHLFATTDLERNYRVNLNVIGLDGRPKVMGLREMLHDGSGGQACPPDRQLNSGMSGRAPNPPFRSPRLPPTRLRARSRCSRSPHPPAHMPYPWSSQEAGLHRRCSSPERRRMFLTTSARPTRMAWMSRTPSTSPSRLQRPKPLSPWTAKSLAASQACEMFASPDRQFLSSGSWTQSRTARLPARRASLRGTSRRSALDPG